MSRMHRETLFAYRATANRKTSTWWQYTREGLPFSSIDVTGTLSTISVCTILAA